MSDPAYDTDETTFDDEIYGNDPENDREEDPGPEEPPSHAEALLLTEHLKAMAGSAGVVAVLLNDGPLDGDVKVHATWLLAIRELKRILSDVEQLASDATAARMTEKTVVVDGLGVLSRHERKSRTKWDREMLRRDVLDSRLVDTNTGEVLDESQADKICHVWNLGAPRVTALKARGLSADDYCETEKRPGWQVEVQGA